MTGYQKLKTETKYLWRYLEEYLIARNIKEYPSSLSRAKNETEKQIAWLKLQIQKAQNETK